MSLVTYSILAHWCGKTLDLETLDVRLEMIRSKSDFQAKVSITRLCKFLKHGDLDVGNVECLYGADHAISVVNGTFSWTDDEPPTLKKLVHSSIPQSCRHFSNFLKMYDI